MSGETKRTMLTVAYDGTAYSGFALQKTSPRPTIEGCLNHALHALTKEDIEVIGASRTDAGVHALGNLAVFDSASPVPPKNFAHALHPLLPRDIRILASRQVPDDFHPRHVKSLKTYEYHILVSPVEIPLLSRYSYRVPFLLDMERMEEAAQYLVGTHDFTSFCNIQTNSKNRARNIEKILMKKRKLSDIPCVEEVYELILTISGNGFLYNMVRIITGTLIRIGEGKGAPEDVKSILEAKDRRAAGPTVPPQGLILMGYEFPDGIGD